MVLFVGAGMQKQAGPDPADGSRLVDPSHVILRWPAVREATSHRLFFGNTNPPMFREEMSRMEYEPGPLSPGTTCYRWVDELTRPGLIVGPLWSFTTAPGPPSPPVIPWSGCMSRPPDWYGSAEALRIAQNVLLYQRNTGGWPQNIDMAVPLTESGCARVRDEKRLTDSTIDNDATTTQIRFLGRVRERQSAGREQLQAGIEAGIGFLLEAQCSKPS